MLGLCLLITNASQSCSNLAPWSMRRKRYAGRSGKTSAQQFANGEKPDVCPKIRCRRFGPAAILNESPRKERRRIQALPAPTPEASSPEQAPISVSRNCHPSAHFVAKRVRAPACPLGG